MGRLFMVRHGRTAWNKSEVFRGIADIPLDEVGRRQASLVRDALVSQAPRAVSIVSSPLARGRETAEIIAGAFSALEVRVDPFFTDIDVGEWNGLTLSEVQARYPGIYEKWVREPHLVPFPGGQDLKEVQDQAWAGIVALMSEVREADVILVSHRLVLKTLILKIIGAGLDSFWNLRLDTGSISVLETGCYGAEDRLTVVRLNDTSHLSPLALPDRIDF